MILTSFANDSGGDDSYLLGDRTSGIAVVIDPGRSIERYLEAAEEHGLRIAHAIATDRRALLLPLYELKKRAGALIHSRASGPPLFSINALLPGSAFTLGRLRFCVPPDSAAPESLFVYDLEGDPERPILVTGSEARPVACP